MFEIRSFFVFARFIELTANTKHFIMSMQNDAVQYLTTSGIVIDTDSFSRVSPNTNTLYD